MSSTKRSPHTFQFKNFTIEQDRCAMKVNSDGVLLGAWAPLPENTAGRFLDVGAGTGVIALLLAERSPTSEVVAVEINEEAAAQAAGNVEASPFKNIEVIAGSIQQYAAESKEQFNLIVTNPPFFSGGVLNDQEDKAVARHTLKLSHGDLLGAVRDLLAPEGKFSVILPLIEGLRLIDLATSYGLHLQRQLAVRPREGKPVHRLLLSFGNSALPRLNEGRSRNSDHSARARADRTKREDQNLQGRFLPAEVQKEELIHYGVANEWTEEYRKLVNDYYLTGR